MQMCAARKRHRPFSDRPRIVVLPGMDGTASLLIEQFARNLCVGAYDSDPERIIFVDYPRDKHLKPAQLRDYVAENYLTRLMKDTRGYILVAQSFSGHVALLIADANASKRPGNHIGTVLVNCFCSCPAPLWARGMLRTIPALAFAQQPPSFVVKSVFFGSSGTASMMDAVQSLVALVLPAVMKARLRDVADESTWTQWKNRKALQGRYVLYLRGADDVLVGATRHPELLQQARPDVEFVTIDKGPHLVLQTDGARCARIVDDWLSKMEEVSTPNP